MVKIHPTAIVDPLAEIGNDVVIGPFCIVEKGVQIGDGTVINARCTIYEGSIIGKGCLLNEGVIIGMQPQDLKYKGEKTQTIIGENTQIRDRASVERGTGVGRGKTIIGPDCLLMGSSHIAHDSILESGVTLAHGVGLSGHVIVQRKAIIGGKAGVHQFCRIGEMAMVGGISKVTQDVPPYLLVDGSPARAVGLNSIGLRRNGLHRDTRRELKRAYRILYQSGLPRTEAFSELEKTLLPSPEIGYFLEFIKESKRGICSARNLSGDDGNS